MPPSLLRVTNLEAVYQDVVLAVRGVSLEVPEAGIVALLGTNGAGKTTTMRCISGMHRGLQLRVTKGSIELKGVSLLGKPATWVVERGLALVPEGRLVFADLTVDENLRLGAYTRSNRAEVEVDYERILDYFPILRKRRQKLAGYLSGGEQQMLAIGRALMARPKLLLLDEPSLGLAPRVVKQIFEILRRINTEEGTAILLIEQNSNLALRFANYGYIIENGRIVLDGPAAELLEHPDVKEFYLGMTAGGEARSYRGLTSYRRRKRWQQ